MVLTGLCYYLLALTGALGLGFGALLGALHASWPAHPWVGPAAAGLHFVGAAAGAALAGRRGSARPEAWAAGGGFLLGASALFALSVTRPGSLLLLRLVGGMGAGALGVGAQGRLLSVVPREAGAAAMGGAVAAGQAGAAFAFWAGPGFVALAGWRAALAVAGGALLLASLPIAALSRAAPSTAPPGPSESPFPFRRLGPLAAAAALAPGAFCAGLVLLPFVLEQQQGTPSHLAGSLAAAAALAPVLAGPLAGVLGDVAARRRSLYSASAALLASIALAFALRPAGPGWGVVFLAVVWGAAGTGLPALFPLAAAMAGPGGARLARVAVGALGHLGTGMILLVAATGAGPFLWVGLAVAAAAGGLVILRVKE